MKHAQQQSAQHRLTFHAVFIVRSCFLFLSACGNGRNIDTIASSEGQEVYSSYTEDFSIVLPSGWVPVDEEGENGVFFARVDSDTYGERRYDKLTLTGFTSGVGACYVPHLGMTLEEFVVDFRGDLLEVNEIADANEVHTGRVTISEKDSFWISFFSDDWRPRELGSDGIVIIKYVIPATQNSVCVLTFYGDRSASEAIAELAAACALTVQVGSPVATWPTPTAHSIEHRITIGTESWILPSEHYKIRPPRYSESGDKIFVLYSNDGIDSGVVTTVDAHSGKVLSTRGIGEGASLLGDGSRVASRYVEYPHKIGGRRAERWEITDTESGSVVSSVVDQITNSNETGRCCALAYQGEKLIVGTSWGNFRVLDPSTSQCVQTLATGADEIRNIYATSNPNRVIIDGVVWAEGEQVIERELVEVYEYGVDGRIGRQVSRQEGAHVLSVGVNALLVVKPCAVPSTMAAKDQVIVVIDLESGHSRTEPDNPLGCQVLSASWVPNRPEILLYGEDGTIILWDPESGRELSQWSVARQGLSPWYLGRITTQVTAHPSGESFIASAYKSALIPFSIDNQGASTLPDRHLGEITALSFGENGLDLYSGADDRSARVWDVQTGSQKMVLWGFPDGGHQILADRGGTTLIGASQTKLVQWDIRTGSREGSMGFGGSHTGWIDGLYSADEGNGFYLSSRDQLLNLTLSPPSIRIGESTLLDTRELSGHGYSGMRLSSGKASFYGSGNEVYVFDLDTGKRDFELNGRYVGDRAYGIESHDLDGEGGRLLIAYGGDVQLVGMDPESRDLLLRGHSVAIEYVRFVMEGAMAISVDWRGDVVLWDLDAMAAVARHSLGDTPSSIAVYDSKVAFGFADSTIRVFDLE